MRSKRIGAISASLALAIAGCSGPAAPGPAASGDASTGPADYTTEWPTFGHDNQRTGVVDGFPVIRDPKVAWHADLDGAVYGQPIVIGGTVFAGTENDTVYALDARTGAVRWSKHLGTPVTRAELPCGNIAPLGITGTLAYDPVTKSVFAVTDTTGGEKTLYGLDAATGAIARKRNVDPPKGDRLAHQQRSALTVLGGRVYVAYGGHAGDCADYIGSVVGVPTTGDAPNISYALPTTREAGIWDPAGGLVTTGSDPHLLYAVGNGESTTGYDGSDSVISLTPDLALSDRFSPDTWADDNANDLDLGTTAPAIVGRFVFTAGKRGVGYVLDGAHLGGIGGEVTQTRVCRSAGGNAVVGAKVYVPCLDGVAQVTIGGDGRMSLDWKTTAPTSGSPVIGGNRVWVTDWNAGELYALDPATGAVRAHLRVGDLPHFATPSLGAGTVFLPTLAGLTAVR